MRNAVSFNLTLKMTSDWHIGSGVGRQGSVDSLVIRDADDLPYAPSSTVAAMWRDAAEQLAHGLDQKAGDGKSGWTGLVTALFGSQPATDPYKGKAPVPSRLSLEHLRLDNELRKALRGPARASLRQALTFIKPGVRIDPRRETAMTDMLRFEEVCRTGAVLTGEASIDTTGVADRDKDTLVAFAFASLRLLERIGGGRRRGLGRCVAHARISDDAPKSTIICNDDKALKHLEGQFRGPSHGVAPAIEALPTPVSSRIDFEYFDPEDDARVEFELLIEALSPLLVMDQRLGNVTTCLDHVPGTMLLPIVARALGEAGVDEEVVTRLITSGRLRVAPAYPTIDGKRGLPMPLRWHWAKGGCHQPRQDGNERTVPRCGPPRSRYQAEGASEGRRGHRMQHLARQEREREGELHRPERKTRRTNPQHGGGRRAEADGGCRRRLHLRGHPRRRDVGERRVLAEVPRQ